MKILGTQCRLSRLLDQVCESIAALDPPAQHGLATYAQIAAARPEVRVHMEAATKGKPQGDALLKLLQTALGTGVLMQVKEIPALVAALVQRIDQRDSAPALRCALVGALAYVAQPRDIVPDDAPGGYGFVDDAAMLIAAVLMLTPATQANAAQIDRLQKSLAGLQGTVPASATPVLQLAVQGIALIYQSMSVLPAQVAEITMRQLLDNPESASAPAAPAGWQSPLPGAAPAGHWSHGAYFEGNDVVIPGGPSLVGGELYIPD